MSRHSESRPASPDESVRARERQRLIGLGERSFHKSYYPELRKRLEELERFRALLDQANDAIFLVRMPEALVVDCNDAAARILGKGRNELPGLAVKEVFQGLGRDEVLGALQHPSEETGKHELLCQENDEATGQCLRAMEMTFSVRDIGEERFAVIVARDVTQRVQAEHALRQAEEKYRSIFEKALEGIFQVSYEGKLLSANPALAAILGYTSPQELAASFENIMKAYEDPAERELFLQEISRTGQVFGKEMRLVRKSGSRIWVSVTARLVRDQDGSALFIEGFINDITARKIAQQKLAELNRRLESLVQQRTQDLERKAQELEEANQGLRELDAMKNVLLSSVSHELRTPLTSVLGFARLIEKDFCRDFQPLTQGNQQLESRSARIRDNLAIIRQESERLTRMINDFLDLSKIESGRLEWNDCEVLVADSVHSALAAVAGMVQDKPELELVVDVEEGLPPLFVDPDRLYQVLLNLLNNAVKFTCKGFVSIKVELTASDELHVVVTDSGPGIPEADHERVFSKFHQVRWDESLGPKPSGTGLGLAICKQIVEHYKGRIWAASPQQGGAAIHFSLPVRR